MMRCGDYALKDGDWKEYKRIFKVEASATEWAKDVQGIMLKSTDFLRRIVAPVGGQGVTLSYLCVATVFLWRTTFGSQLE